MPRTNVRAARYAEAAFGVARRQDQLDAWLDALERAAALFVGGPAGPFLTSPVVAPSRKIAALAELLPGLPPTIANFLEILTQRGRLDLVPQIAANFRRLLHEHQGIAVVQVTTAFPLDERQRELLGGRLAARVGKRVQLETHVDPAILGGVVAQIGDDVIDGSVRGRLVRLRRSMMA